MNIFWVNELINETIIVDCKILSLVSYLWRFLTCTMFNQVQRVRTEMRFSCLKVISSCAGHLFKWEPVLSPQELQKREWMRLQSRNVWRERKINPLWNKWTETGRSEVLKQHTRICPSSSTVEQSCKNNGLESALILLNTGSWACQEATLPPGGQPGTV